MLLSATLRDSKGNIIAEIVNNTWSTVDRHYQLSFNDRNYNAYAFEIIRSDGVPMFQVAMVGSNKIQIGGIFYSTNPKIGEVDIAPLSNGTAVMSFNLNDTELEAEHIPTLFKYPCLTRPS